MTEDRDLRETVYQLIELLLSHSTLNDEQLKVELATLIKYQRALRAIRERKVEAPHATR